MTYIWQRWMAEEFRAAGLEVIEVAGWENRGRPASTGHYDPDQGITNHHTASTTSPSNPAPTIGLLISGRLDLPGPLAPWSVDYLGRVWIIAAGRCNHAGEVGKPFPGTYVGADGNAIFMGDEIDTNGTQQMSPAQRRSVAITNRIYLEHFDRPLERLHRHQDISGTGKWDLGSLTTPQLRADAAAVDTQEDPMADPKIQDQLDRIEANSAAAAESAAKAARLAEALRKRGTTQTARLRKGIDALRAKGTVTAVDLAPLVESLDDIEATLAAAGQEA